MKLSIYKRSGIMLRERGGYNPYCYLPPFSAAALSAWLTHLLNIQIVNIQN